MKPLFYFFVLTLALGGNKNDSTSSSTKAFDHPNGLRALIEFEHSEVTQNENGFLVYVNPKNSRLQSQIKIEYRITPPNSLSEEKHVDGKQYKFALETYNEGSSGEEKVLTIWKPMDTSKGILIEHYEQGDPAVAAREVWALAIASKRSTK